MPLGVAQDPSDEQEAAALEALRLADEQQAGQAGDNPPDPSEQPPGDAPATEGTGQQAAAPAAPAEPSKTKLNPHAVVRAARRSEERALREAERLRQEVEALRAKLPAEAPTPPADEIVDDELERVAVDYPGIAPVLNKLVSTVKKVTAAAPPPPATALAPEPAPEFVPMRLPPNVQEQVDAIPDLFEWQHDPDQTAFQLAIAADKLLMTHPKWKDKTQAERYVEVVRRVKADLGDSGSSQPSDGGIDPVDEAIRNAPARQPKSPSELGGGGGRADTHNDLVRFSGMSAEEVEAELALRG